MVNDRRHLERGKQAEQRACEYLEKKGLRLIEKNFACYTGEVDLIMQDRNHVVFVEVRSRNRTDYGNALESVNYHKQKKIIKTATTFLQQRKWLYKVHSRFDIIAIHPVNGVMRLDWIQNAFEAAW